MQQRQLGRTGPLVSAIGLGCMGMSSGIYGPSNRAEGIATIHAAVETGVTLFDTGDFYGMGHNETLLGEALRGTARDKAVVSVKFGAMRSPSGQMFGTDARPVAVRNFLTYSLGRLGLDYVDIYRPARLDPAVPIEDTVGAIKEMIEAGYVRHIGLSEVGEETIRRAAAAHPVADLQIEYSVLSRGIEDRILPTCRELGIGITAYGVLSRGLLSSSFAKRTYPAGDIRNRSPRFESGNLDANLLLVDKLRTIAEAKGLNIAQLAFAWVAAQGADIVPLVGARRPEHLHEALGSLDVGLTPDDLTTIAAAIPRGAVVGTRYGPAQMADLDSERGC